MTNYITTFKKLDNIDKFIYEWTYDTDIEDYYDKWNYGKIHYKSIIELLLTLQYHNKIKIKDKDIHLNNIIKLYKTLKKVPTIIRPKDLYIYRGFNYDRYKLLFKFINNDNIKVNSLITTPTFLSTSVIKDVMFRFVSYNKNYNKNILWKIIVPHKKLQIFNYVYLGDNVNLKTLNKNSLQKESEILLNIGAVLKCIKIKKIYHLNKIYKHYTYEFVEWNDVYNNYLINKIISKTTII